MNCNSIIGKSNLIEANIYIYKPHIIAITETKIDGNYDDNELLGPEYSVWRNDRRAGGGGVLIAIANSAPVSVLHGVVGPGESITLSLQGCSKQKFKFSVMYRPPNEYNLQNLEDLVESIMHDNCLLVGDFNLPDIKWNVEGKTGVVAESSRRKAFHTKALNIIEQADLYQQITVPTHKKGNTLDLVLVSKPALSEFSIKSSVLPYISDHSIILSDITYQDYPNHKETSSGPTRPKFNFIKADYKIMEHDFKKLHTTLLSKAEHDIDEHWNLLKQQIGRSLETIPVKLSRPKGHPWMTRTIKRKMNKLKRLFARNRRFPSIKNLEEYNACFHDIKVSLRNAKINFYDHISDEMGRGNTKPLFNHLARRTGRSNMISGLKNTPSDQIPNKLSTHFESVFTDTQYDTPNMAMYDCAEMNEIELSKTGIKSLLMELDPRKSGGPDNISAMTLKMFATNIPSFVDCVKHIMQLSIQEGNVPSDWKRANIAPIFKGGDRSEANNYRPISLTCILCKICEHILASNMWKHIENNSLISKQQHGFQKNLNTTTQLLHVVHFASRALDQKKDYHIISFDFTKAFDRVPHRLLLHKLLSYRFNTPCINWIKSWLSGRSSSVVVNGVESREFPICSGVPQGSVLGPLLFLLYIDDLVKCINHSDCRLYADDTLLCTDLSTCNLEALQSDINKLLSWTEAWGMLFNSKKCVHIQVGKELPIHSLYLGDEEIPRSNTLKYLGVHIDASLKWNNHINKVVKKANRALGMLKRGLHDAPCRIKLSAYKSIVRPLLEYCTQVWSPYNIGLINSLERVQRNAMKWALQLTRYDSITSQMHLNGFTSLAYRREDQDTKFLRKVEAGLFAIDIREYIQFTPYNTRHQTVSCQQHTNQWKNSYFNRVREKVVALSDDNTPIPITNCKIF